MKQKTVFKLLPISVWLASFGFVFLTQLKSGQFINNPYFTISESIIVSLWFIGNFYLFYSVIIPSYLDKNRLKHFVILSLAFLIISPLLIDLALKMNKIIFSLPASRKITIWGFMGGIFGSLISGGIGFFLRIIIDWFTNRQKKIELENKNLESELKLLKARLNPHFLFNTINNIDTLIIENPEKASELLSKLSDLLRYVLYDTETDKTELGDEIIIIEKYIELQKIRISNPENIHLNIDCNNLHFQIPPMLFFPFIENAFKHSDLNKPDQNITIDLTYNKKSIKFMCKNNFTTNEKPRGIGLELIRRRLELYFPNAFTLAINANNDIYEINLFISLNED